jgi:hypothetical protein
VSDAPQGHLLELVGTLIVDDVRIHNGVAMNGMPVLIIDAIGQIPTGYDTGEGENVVQATQRMIVPAPLSVPMSAAMLNAVVWNRCTCDDPTPENPRPEEFHPHD